jgi:hypothetical protein
MLLFYPGADTVVTLIAGLPNCNPLLPPFFESRIAALAEFAVRARTHVKRDGHRKEIIYEPESESPTRLAQQLAQLAKGSALIGGHSVVTSSDYVLVRRVGMDCIPAVRRKILESLMTGDDSQLAKTPASTRSYAEQELESLGLLIGSGTSAVLTTDALALTKQAKLQ